MNLGAFSVSLAVKDLEASRRFYEQFGFTPFAGDGSQNWLILKNGDHVIGLFQGMFERNTLTFNPGWDQDANALGDFTDVRELQRRLKEVVEAVVELDDVAGRLEVRRGARGRGGAGQRERRRDGRTEATASSSFCATPTASGVRWRAGSPRGAPTRS